MTFEEKPKVLVAQEEQDKISRNVLVWLNTYPDLPIGIDFVRYEELKDDMTGLMLSTIQGAYILERYILGGYKAEYQFKLVYRVNPGMSMDKRLEADEFLNGLAAWARDNIATLNLGDGLRVVSVIPTTLSSLFAIMENGDEDHQVLMNLTYEVI